MKTVFTSGCFDILTMNHVFMLMEARKLGDRLIVGVNDDTSVRRLKGEGRRRRPINPAQTRAQILQALKPVDEVVVFSETTATELLNEIRPDILVNGNTPEKALVRTYGGVAVRLPETAWLSTTEIIERCSDATTTVEVCHRLMDRKSDGQPKYHASIRGMKAWAAGNTPNEAIGDLVRCHPELFGVKVEYLKGESR